MSDWSNVDYLVLAVDLMNGMEDSEYDYPEVVNKIKRTRPKEYGFTDEEIEYVNKML